MKIQMLKRSKSLQIFVAAGAILLVAGFIPFSQAQLELPNDGLDIQGQVTIEALNCGLTSPTTSISFGNLANNVESGNILVQITNDGTTPGDSYIRGNFWKDTITENAVMNVGDTHYGLLSQAYADKQVLTDTEVLVGSQPVGVQTEDYFQLMPNLIDPGYTGNAIQTISYTIYC